MIRERIGKLDHAAYVKNSELAYVAANEAYVRLLGLNGQALEGRTSAEIVETVERLDLEDRERRCLVFGEDQIAAYADPFGGGRFQVEMERFVGEDQGIYVYGVFEPVSSRVKSTALEREIANADVSGELTNGLDHSVAENILDTLEVGVCVYDREDRLVYINAKTQEFYRPLIGALELGTTLRQALERFFDSREIPATDNDDAMQAGRAAWIEERLQRMKAPHWSDTGEFNAGHWVKFISKRLANGILISLQVDVSDMKERESLLEKNVTEVELFRTLLNALPVPTFVRGEDHRITFANTAYGDIFHVSVDELVGTTEVELFGKDGEALHQFNRESFEHGVIVQEEQDLEIRKGEQITVLTRVSRIVTENNKKFLIGSMTDIATLRNREKQLKAANAKAKAVTEDFRNIIASMDVGLVVLDKNLDIEIMNRAAKKLWALGDDAWMDNVIGMPFRGVLEIYHNRGIYDLGDVDFETFVNNRLSEITSKRIRPREHQVTDGTVFLYSSIPLSDGRFLLCYVDITKTKALDREVARAHGQVERALQLVRNATDAMPQGMMVIDGETITFANETLHKLLGVEPSVCQAGAPWSQFLEVATDLEGGASWQFGGGQADRLAQSFAEKRDVNCAFPLAGGRWIQLQSRNSENGQTVVLFTDLTDVIAREQELKTLVQRAENADRAKSEFLANMSHEIRTPMNGILGMAELLSKTHLDVRQKTFVDIVDKSGNALMTIINDILDFSKLDADQITLRNAAFDPGEAIEDVASLLAARAVDKNVELIVRRHEGLPDMVMGDAGRFRQIITNLVGNGLKFTERGHVQVSIGSVPSSDGQVKLEIVVEDTGIGIPADKLSQVFEKFSQVDGSSTRRHEGTGLGLAITEGLVDLHGGSMGVESEAGRGSMFTVNLPMAVARTRSKPRPIPRHIEGARILVVDDNAASQAMLTETLQEWNFDAVAVGDGQAACEVLDGAEAAGLAVDAILLDNQLNDENGVDVARMIRADARFDNVAIILLTSIEAVCDEWTFAELNIAAQLMKPVRSGLLRDAMIDVVRVNRGRAASVPKPAPETGSHPANLSLDSGSARSGVNAVASVIAAGDSQGLDVLIAEDNEVNQIVFRQILENTGLSFKIVDNGLLAIETWQAEKPKIILMDVSMPVMNGLAATRHIRELEGDVADRVAIVGVTAHVLDSDLGLCLESGMDDYLSKPISPEKLEEKIHAWMNPDQNRLKTAG